MKTGKVLSMSGKFCVGILAIAGAACATTEDVSQYNAMVVQPVSPTQTQVEFDGEYAKDFAAGKLPSLTTDLYRFDSEGKIYFFKDQASRDSFAQKIQTAQSEHERRETSFPVVDK